MTALKRLRIEAGLRIEEVCVGTGIPLSSYLTYERGRGLPLARAKIIAEHLAIFLERDITIVLSELAEEPEEDTEALKEAA